MFFISYALLEYSVLAAVTHGFLVAGLMSSNYILNASTSLKSRYDWGDKESSYEAIRVEEGGSDE